MGTPIDYIYENELQLQPSFKGELGVPGRFGYRGELTVTSTKIIIKHAIVISNADEALLFAAELEDFANFEASFECYKKILTPNTLVTLFVGNLLSNVVFEYKGVTVYAFALDESSVWNELVDYADLDKKELKRMSAEDKLDNLYDGIKNANLYVEKKTYEEACALKMS
ncbi:MAG: hypothetical protein FP820_01750 [Sulfurimonas sp.]|jgi:hypothetical protein|nr:hypothetical protein [Sulfurimonas sp.]MBU1216082.1 hypothetical protein [bacterium]MBU1434388.1 hypothetical protein [bacterium]MBU1501966.1 hypothetical protein [bacterium]MBU3939619.1 hypothetical protein [bacterium]